MPLLKSMGHFFFTLTLNFYTPLVQIFRLGLIIMQSLDCKKKASRFLLNNLVGFNGCLIYFKLSKIAV